MNIRDVRSLDRAGRIGVVAFNREAVLGEGNLRVFDVTGVEVVGSDLVLRYAAAADSGSSHPIAQAILVPRLDLERARALAAELGVDDLVSDMAPLDRTVCIALIQEKRAVTAFLGTKNGDIAATAQVDVGFGVAASKTPVAEASDILLNKDDLHAIPFAKVVAEHVKVVMRQNLMLAVVPNLSEVPFALGLLHPWFGWCLTLPTALIVALLGA